MTASLQVTHRWANISNYSANLHEVLYFVFPTGFHSQVSLGFVNLCCSVRFGNGAAQSQVLGMGRIFQSFLSQRFWGYF